MGPRELEPDDVAAAIGRREPRGLARALTWVEAHDPRADVLLEMLPRGPRAFRLGITGAPGVGKSSLIARLIPVLRSRGELVAVIAVDPTSPLSGGALLGDRIRMSGLGEDEGVFIRSVASRGMRGGLAACTIEAAEILERAGFSVIIVETVGVGQLELEVVEEADRSFLLLSPESGDQVQLLKGGLMELVSHVVVNKVDRPGGAELLRLVRELATDRGNPVPSAVSCATGEGIEELGDLIDEEATAMRRAGDRERDLRRVERLIERRVEETWVSRLWGVEGHAAAARAARGVLEGKLSFSAAVQLLLDRAGDAHDQ